MKALRIETSAPPRNVTYGTLGIEFGGVDDIEERPNLPLWCDSLKASSSVFTWALMTVLAVVTLRGAADWEATMLLASSLFSVTSRHHFGFP